MDASPYSFITSVSIRRFVEVCLEGSQISFKRTANNEEELIMFTGSTSWITGLGEDTSQSLNQS